MYFSFSNLDHFARPPRSESVVSISTRRLCFTAPSSRAGAPLLIRLQPAGIARSTMVGRARKSGDPYVERDATSTMPHRLSLRDLDGRIAPPTFLIFPEREELRLETKVTKNPGVIPPRPVGHDASKHRARGSQAELSDVHARDRAGEFQTLNFTRPLEDRVGPVVEAINSGAAPFEAG